MSEVVCELIVSLDGFAKGQRSPGYYGYYGPDFDNWVKTNSALPHRTLIGRKTYELMNGMPTQARDESFEIMTKKEGWLFSKTLKKSDWPGLKVVSRICSDHHAASTTRTALLQSSSSDCARRRSKASLISWSTKIAMAAMRCRCSGLNVL